MCHVAHFYVAIDSADKPWCGVCAWVGVGESVSGHAVSDRDRVDQLDSRISVRRISIGSRIVLGDASKADR